MGNAHTRHRLAVPYADAKVLVDERDLSSKVQNLAGIQAVPLKILGLELLKDIVAQDEGHKHAWDDDVAQS